MTPDLPRITVVTGGYGSGKTEVSIALAQLLRRTSNQGSRVALVDLDIVNPYFRSRDADSRLAGQSIEVIAPAGALKLADLPALPPGISGAIADTAARVVIDVGGDPAGATALGRYSPELTGQGYEMLFVINPYRPHTGSVEAVLDVLLRVEKVSRLKVTGLVNNGNVMEYSGMAELRRGQEIAEQVGKELNLPVRFAACKPDLAIAARDELDIPVLELAVMMRPPW